MAVLALSFSPSIFHFSRNYITYNIPLNVFIFFASSLFYINFLQTILQSLPLSSMHPNRFIRLSYSKIRLIIILSHFLFNVFHFFNGFNGFDDFSSTLTLFFQKFNTVFLYTPCTVHVYHS